MRLVTVSILANVVDSQKCRLFLKKIGEVMSVSPVLYIVSLSCLDK
jgi:hypothetical protein